MVAETNNPEATVSGFFFDKITPRTLNAATLERSWLAPSKVLGLSFPRNIEV